MLQFAVEEFAWQLRGGQAARVDRVVAQFRLRQGKAVCGAADCVEAEVGEEGAVGVEDRIALHVGHEHRRVEAIQHRDEAFMRRAEFGLDAFGFGDVAHRGHPAGLLARGIHQRRDHQARIAVAAVLAADPQFKAIGWRFARQ